MLAWILNKLNCSKTKQKPKPNTEPKPNPSNFDLNRIEIVLNPQLCIESTFRKVIDNWMSNAESLNDENRWFWWIALHLMQMCHIIVHAFIDRSHHGNNCEINFRLSIGIWQNDWNIQHNHMKNTNEHIASQYQVELMIQCCRSFSNWKCLRTKKSQWNEDILFEMPLACVQFLKRRTEFYQNYQCVIIIMVCRQGAITNMAISRLMIMSVLHYDNHDVFN